MSPDCCPWVFPMSTFATLSRCVNPGRRKLSVKVSHGRIIPWPQNPLDISVNPTTLGAMNTGNPDRDVYERIARLEERINTMQAKSESALDRNNAAFERLRADMAQRDKQLIFAMIAIVALGFTIFGFVTA